MTQFSLFPCTSFSVGIQSISPITSASVTASLSWSVSALPPVCERASNHAPQPADSRLSCHAPAIPNVRFCRLLVRWKVQEPDPYTGRSGRLFHRRCTGWHVRHTCLSRHEPTADGDSAFRMLATIAALQRTMDHGRTPFHLTRTRRNPKRWSFRKS